MRAIGPLLRERLPAPAVAALEPVARARAVRRYRVGPLRRSYPSTPDALRASPLASAWWYYSIELLPGMVMPGQFPAELPMLPRMLLRRCDVRGRACLDIGPMDGLIPTLLAKRGAGEVLAVDYSNHSLGRLDAVRHYHGVDFDFRTAGLMYRLHEQLAPRGFDVINCSGLLYHVFSPLSVLASVRSLIKPGGIMIVATNVTLDSEPAMQFNVAGRLQREANTFWYPSAGLLDYLLRYLRLEPIDRLSVSHAHLGEGFELDRPSGYMAIACRAVESVAADEWARESAERSWEYLGLCDWGLATSHEPTDVAYDAPAADSAGGATGAMPAAREASWPADEQDSHVLRLAATS